MRGTLSEYKFLRVNMINEPHHAKMNLTFLQTVNTQPHLTVIPCRIAILKYMNTLLKVGSCPNDDNSVQFFICPFLCSS